MKKRLLSMLLILCMVISMLPMSVLAAEATADVVVYRDPVVDYANGTDETDCEGFVSGATLDAWKNAILAEAGAGADSKIEYYIGGNWVELSRNFMGTGVDMTVGFGYSTVLNGNTTPKTETRQVKVTDGETVTELKVAIQNYVTVCWDVAGTHDAEKVIVGETPVYSGSADVLYWTPSVVPTSTVAGDVEYTATLKDAENPVVVENVATSITAKEAVTLPYGASSDALLDAAEAVLSKKGATIAVSPNPASLDAGTYDVTLSYAGEIVEETGKVTIYAPCQATVKVTISKMTGATVGVDNAVVKYGTAVDPNALIHSAYSTIDVLAGLDVHNERDLSGIVSIALGIDPALVAEKLGVPADNVPMSKLNELLGYVGEIAPIKPETVNKVINTVETLQGLLKSKLGVNSTVTIQIVNELPVLENVGAYLLASAVSDPNYETELGAGYIVIYPDGTEVELAWDYDDPNYILTLDKATSVSLGAHSTNLPEANDQIETLFIGLDQHVVDGLEDGLKEGLKEGLFVGKTLPEDVYPGVYLEIAMVLHWDNEMYYSMPLVRPVVVAPNVAKVEFADNNAVRAYRYDGTQRAMTVTVDGVTNPAAGELKVRYIGIDGHASLKGVNLTTELSNIYDGPDAAVPPTEAGIYLVVALYADREDSTGKLITAGGNVGVLVIEPANPNYDLTAVTEEYDGNQYFSTIKENGPTGLEFVKIAVERTDANNADYYVVIPENLQKLATKLPASLEEKVMPLLVETNAFEIAMLKNTAGELIAEIQGKNLSAALMSEMEAVMDKLSAKISEYIDVYGNKAENFAESKIESVLTEKLGDKLPADLIDLVSEIVTFENNDLSVVEKTTVINKAKALSKQLIVSQLGAEIDAVVQGKIDSIIDEVVTVVYDHEKYGVDHLVSVINKALDVLEDLDVAHAEKVLKVALAVASKVIDPEEVKAAIEIAYNKALERGYGDYLKSLIVGLDTIVDVDIDPLKDAVLALEPMIKDLAKRFASEELVITEANLKVLEDHLDNVILPAVLDIIMNLPDGTIYINQMPSEVGHYETYAINLSANYAPVIESSTLDIVEPVCEHKWSEVFVDVEPTCTEDGAGWKYCEICKITEDVIIPALGHTAGDPVVENEVAADCVNDGSYDTVVYCTVCGEELSRETTVVPALGHTAGDPVVENEVAADCVNDGSYDTVVYCTVCGEEVRRETTVVPALGHTAGDPVVENEVAADCVNAGSYDTVVYCTVCGEEVSRETTVVPALGHTAGDPVVENEVAADCVNAGSYDTVVYCTVCGEEVSRETTVVPALGHTAGDPVVENEVAADCVNAGSYDTVVYCTVCGEEVSRETTVVPALGHDWSEWVVTKEAAVGVAGEETRTCKRCGETETRPIPALPEPGHEHKYFCSNDGDFDWSFVDGELIAVAVFECECGEIHEEELKIAAGIEVVERKAATCDAKGYVKYEASASYGGAKGSDVYTEVLPIDPDAHYPGCPHDVKPDPKPDYDFEWGPCCDMDFDDVKPHHWFYNDVHYVYCSGLMKGISKDLFGPDMTTTRGMIVTILYRMEGEPRVKTDCQFTDVAADMYYADPITWAAANGIVNGYDADTFGPNDSITREQMAAILFRYAEFKGYDTDDRADLSIFTDADKISAYAVEAMSWAVAEGLINGMGDGTVAPQGNAIRAQVAALLHRYCVKVADLPEKIKR